MSGGVLAGMRIVEVSAFVAAPLGGMTLAQMGADVIRIDRPGGGLDYRRWPVTEANASLFWAGLNKSKRSVTIDTSTGEGRELAQALITAAGDDAGMLLTNMPPRGWLDYGALSTRREDLIQLTVQGRRGGGSAVDHTVNTTVGLPFLTGPEDCTDVVNHILPAWDLVTGQMAAVGLLAAERRRRINGGGRHVMLALEDVALATISNLGILGEAELGVRRGRYGNYLYGAFGRDFETGDQQRVMVIGLTAKQWRSLCSATEIVEGVQALEQGLGVDLGQEGERFKVREQLAALMEPWFAARSLQDIATIFDAAGVCWSHYQSVLDLVNTDPRASAGNPLLASVIQPDIGELLAPGIPLDFGADQLAPEAAPKLGAHTEEVLSGVLGMSSVEIGLLYDKGVL